MPIEITTTNMDGLLTIKPHMFFDERGLYKKCYEENIYKQYGINEAFTETSDIYSKKGALRGLHYQLRYEQAKLIHVVSGSIFDVVVDIRPNSRTFGCWHGELLSGKDHKILYIPKGFAHGFLSLEDNTIFSYQCSGKYDPDSCGGILWNDPDLNISWPLHKHGIQKVICTQKDSSWPTFTEFCNEVIHHE